MSKGGVQKTAGYRVEKPYRSGGDDLTKWIAKTEDNPFRSTLKSF